MAATPAERAILATLIMLEDRLRSGDRNADYDIDFDEALEIADVRLRKAGGGGGMTQ